jgi:LCP family protein required for cell wall assembly
MILALGIDRRQSGYDYGLADAIRLVRADFSAGEVTVLTLPRDLWVMIPGLEERGILEGKLSQVYYYGSEYYGMYDDPDYGPGLMAVTLQLNYGVQIDRYLAVNMQSLEAIIDAVGGVDLTLPYDVDGKSTDPEDPFDLGYFPAGNHHFDGETTLRFARIRMMDNDYQRTTRQSLVLEALWEKIVSPSILPKVPGLVEILSGSLQMDLRAEDIPPLVCLAPLLDEDTLIFVNVPLEMLHETRVYVDHIENTVFAYRVDRDEFSQFLDDFQRGIWP